MGLLRVLEVVGGIVAAVFALLGLNGLLHLDAGMTVVELLYQLATQIFIIVFNVVAAVLCFVSSDRLSKTFGFLATWAGRGIFFLVMGCCLYPAVCPKFRYEGGHCFDFDEKDVLTLSGVVASITSIVLGVVILVLRCIVIDEPRPSDVTGVPKQMNWIDICSLVASCGMLLLAGLMLSRLNLEGSVRDFCRALSTVFIIMTFGLASLLASCRTSGFVATYFGFLEHGWQRGVFYLLMGFYTAALFYPSDTKQLQELVGLVCSVISIAVGTVQIIIGLM